MAPSDVSATSLRGASPRLSEPAVVIIDSQPGFIQYMAGDPRPLELRLEKLVHLAERLELPVLATFEEPAVHGWLPDACEALWPAGGLRHEKHTYDCCGGVEIADAIAALGRRQLLVAGAETDVCVLQSVLSLLERDYEVFLLEDCLFSSEPNVGPALRRMYAAGVVPCTLKTAYYELMRDVRILRDPAAGGPRWERLLADFGMPEEWLPWEPKL